MGVSKVIYGGETLVDLTSDSVTPDTLLEGETAHDAAGNKITGRLVIPTVITLTSIAITTPPTKTVYGVGETFNPAGMVVKATYSNGVTAVISGYSYSPTGALASGTTEITIQYTEGGVTVSAKQNITVKKTYDATFANNSWADIAEACATNSVPSSWVVGNSKAMTIGGTSYQIDIIGKNHDTYAAGGTAPLTFQMHDCYGTAYTMGTASDGTSTNNGGFGSTAMKSTHLPAIKALMPSEVKSAIKNVNKKNSRGNKSTNILTVSCDLFLLSEVEVFGTTAKTPSGEGSQYEYYSAGNSNSKAGSSNGWWLRSPDISSSTSFCYVQNGYVAVRSVASGGTKNIAFAFCF
jgi:hypothetical protein